MSTSTFTQRWVRFEINSILGIFRHYIRRPSPRTMSHLAMIHFTTQQHIAILHQRMRKTRSPTDPYLIAVSQHRVMINHLTNKGLNVFDLSRQDLALLTKCYVTIKTIGAHLNYP